MDTYKLTIVISSGCIAAFMRMKQPSLSLLTNLGLKPTLSHISTNTPAFFGGWGSISLVNLLPNFHPKAIFICVYKVGFL
jgi:hypothetical protein